MKTRISFFVIAIILFASGCIPSLHPLYTAQTIILNKKLNGTWSQMNVDQDMTIKDGNKEIKIVGKIEASDNKNEWQFRKAKNGNYYNLTYFEDGNPSSFDVHLLKLGEHLFFDFYPNDDLQKKPKEGQKDLFEGTLINSFKNSLQGIHYHPVHTFAKVNITENQLEIHQFDTDWIGKLFKERKIRIKHESTDYGIILTAPTEDLQKFVTKYAEEDDAYNDTIVLKRTSL